MAEDPPLRVGPTLLRGDPHEQRSYGVAVYRVTLSHPLRFVCALAVVAYVAGPAPAAAQTSLSYLTYHNPTRVDIPDGGAATTYPISIPVAGLTGTVGRVVVILQGLTHARTDDLDVLLVSPSGDRTMLMSDVVGSMADGYVTIGQSSQPILVVHDGLTEGGPADVAAGGPDTFPAPAPAGPYPANLNVFAGEDPNGTWQLFIVDDNPGNAGSLGGVTLLIEPRFRSTTIALVPPSGTSGITDSSLRVRGLRTRVARVEATVHIIHPNVGDLALTLIAPDGTAVRLATHVGGAGDNFGTFCDNPTTFSSAAFNAPPIASGTAPFPDVYEPEQSLDIYNGKSGDAVNGIWTLRINDTVNGNAGALVCWSLAFTTALEPLAPVNLTATAIAGNQLSLWWQLSYPFAATSYLLEGGINPGETLAQIPLDSPASGVTLSVPSGVFYVRLRGRWLNEPYSNPSNEVRVAVNALVAPSPPKNLRVTRNGSSVDFSWTNSYEGGAPTSLALDVSGSASATIPLALGDSVSIADVPTGNFAVRLRAINAAGSSAPTAPVPVLVPSASCTNAPATPVRFIAYAVGGVVHLRWEQPGAGGAATSYALIVAGDYTGSFTLTQAQVATPAPPGSYQVRVIALNQCGASGPTLGRTVTVP